MRAVVLCVLASLLGATPAAAEAPVLAQAETAPNFDDDAGGNADADDPAIWRHPTNPAASVVVGTLKNGGLTVFDLHGRTVQSLPAGSGRFNNVDILQGTRIGGRTIDIAVVSDRGRDRLRIYSIDRRGRLTEMTSASSPLVFSADEAESRSNAPPTASRCGRTRPAGRHGWW